MILTERAEHVELRETVRKILERESPLTKIVADAALAEGYDRALWRRLAQDIGVAGLAVPDRHGGSGATAQEDAIVAEELGRSLACTPYLATVALAANLLMIVDDEAASSAWLPAITAGEQTATVVYRGLAGEFAADCVPIAASHRGGVWTLDGTARFVLDGHSADLLLVFATTGAGAGAVSLFAVEGGSARVTQTRMKTLDHTRSQAQLEFAGAPATLLGAEGAAWPWAERMLDLAAVSLAAEQVGGADRALESAVAYAKMRVQFGRVIGSFQAIKHRCADLAVDNDRARSAVAHATWAASEPSAGERLPGAAAMAALVCGPAFVRAAQESIQIHGGIGFTWEHPAHRYFRRAKADAVALAGERYFVERLLSSVGA